MASAGPYQARMQPTPPIKGSFPLDHEKVCAGEMIEYMLCLQVCDELVLLAIPLQNTRRESAPCRHLARDYFACRMKNNLMDKDEWSLLGFTDDAPSTRAHDAKS
jgi:cytochrome c oxidase assembly protein subunit 19